MADTNSSTYKDAGVDIEAGDQLVDRIKPAVRRTMRPEVLGGLGGFGALIEVPLERYRRPVMVAGTDGVGTKLRLAIETGRHDTIGIDLVAMCANDVVVQGAEPLFFLDYYATGKLQVPIAEQVIEGVVEGCLRAGCALVGGETAEMPGMYEGEDYDLAGFCVGMVEKDRIVDGSRVSAGDTVIGLESSGAHSNGYSLIRKLLAQSGTGPETMLDGTPVFDLLLAPTRIYVKPLLALLRDVPVHAIAHITGGGPAGNIPRVLPDGLEAVIETDSWPQPTIFDWLQKTGNIERREMLRTFNCGIGMTIVVARDDTDRSLDILRRNGEEPRLLGEIRAGNGGVLFQ